MSMKNGARERCFSGCCFNELFYCYCYLILISVDSVVLFDSNRFGRLFFFRSVGFLEELFVFLFYYPHLNCFKTKHELIIFHGSPHSVLISLIQLCSAPTVREKKTHRRKTKQKSTLHMETSGLNAEQQIEVRRGIWSTNTVTRIGNISACIPINVRVHTGTDIPANIPYFWKWLFLFFLCIHTYIFILAVVRSDSTRAQNMHIFWNRNFYFFFDFFLLTFFLFGAVNRLVVAVVEPSIHFEWSACRCRYKLWMMKNQILH